MNEKLAEIVAAALQEADDVVETLANGLNEFDRLFGLNVNERTQIRSVMQMLLEYPNLDPVIVAAIAIRKVAVQRREPAK